MAVAASGSGDAALATALPIAAPASRSAAASAQQPHRTSYLLPSDLPTDLGYREYPHRPPQETGDGRSTVATNVASCKFAWKLEPLHAAMEASSPLGAAPFTSNSSFSLAPGTVEALICLQDWH
ncbi:hypothetical protein ACP70R_011261 [Stipagrostis hirtigluma subsp. patula]